MGETALVGPRIDAGRRVLVRLDERGVPVDAAFWYLSEGEWSFNVHSSLVEDRGRSGAYEEIQAALADSDGLSMKDIRLLRADDSLLTVLRTLLSTGGTGVTDIRLTRNTVNGIFIEDLHVYRM